MVKRYVDATEIQNNPPTHSHSEATTSTSGFQSAADKSKIDGIEAQANRGLASIDGVSNPGGDVDLVAGTDISITPNDTANTITVAYTGTGGGGTAGVGSIDGVSPASSGGNIDLVEGSNITITPNDASDNITIAATVPDLQGHLDDTSDAHDASAISVLDTAENFTSTDVEGALAELAVASGTSTLVSVKEYGAVGDGTTDDTAAIQAAINANRAVYFPPTTGGYGVSSVISVPSDRTLLGCGYPGRLKKLSPTTSFQILRNSGATAVNNVTLDSIVVQGDWDHALTHPSGASEGYCILFATNPGTTSCKNITIRNCEVRDWWGLPFRIEGGDVINFENNTVNWSSRDGITIRDKVTNLRVNNNTLLNLGDDGIAINARNDDLQTDEYPRNFEVTGNVVHIRPNASFGAGIIARGARYGVISGNTVYGAILAGISLRHFNLKDPQFINVVGNTVIGNEQQESAAPIAIGIEVKGNALKGIKVENNEIHNPESYGIQLVAQTSFSADDISISSNSVSSAGNASNATTDGINAVGGGTIKSLKIDNNVIRSSARCAIITGSATFTSLSVSGNQVASSSVHTALQQIRLEGSTTRFICQGNICTEGTSSSHGIRIFAGVNNGLVANNVAFDADHGGAGTGISNSGTNNTLANNKVA